MVQLLFNDGIQSAEGLPPWSGLGEILMGVSGVAGTLPRLVVKRAAVCAWFGVGGEARLQVQRVGCQGAR
jgi:hypothetical protein